MKDLRKVTVSTEKGKKPKFVRSYENDDADGNRGIWMTFVVCPECKNEFYDDEIGKDCDCGCKIDWSKNEDDIDFGDEYDYMY